MNYWQFLFAVHQWMYRQLELDYFYGYIAPLGGRQHSLKTSGLD